MNVLEKELAELRKEKARLRAVAQNREKKRKIKAEIRSLKFETSKFGKFAKGFKDVVKTTGKGF